MGQLTPCTLWYYGSHYTHTHIHTHVDSYLKLTLDGLAVTKASNFTEAETPYLCQAFGAKLDSHVDSAFVRNFKNKLFYINWNKAYIVRFIHMHTYMQYIQKHLRLLCRWLLYIN